MKLKFNTTINIPFSNLEYSIKFISMNWSLKDVGNLENKVAIVTGASSGLGFETSKALASKNCTVILAVRNLEKGESAVVKIKQIYPNADLRMYKLDLTDLASVKQFSNSIKKNFKGIDFLINNAGVMNIPYSKTVDGFETQFGGNHLGHFALTGMLLDHMNKDSRIVTVSSFLAKSGIVNFDDINSEKSYQGFKAYAQSKLANLMFALELQKRIEKDSRKILSLAAHPGYASTNLFSAGGGRFGSAKIFSRIFAQPASQGVLPILRAALDKAAQGGEFYGPSFFGMRGSPVKVTIFENALNTKVSKKLWEVSEELTSTNSLKLD